LQWGSVNLGCSEKSTYSLVVFFFFQAEDGIRDRNVTGVQTCALPILPVNRAAVMQRFLRGVLAEGPAVFDNRREALHARNGFHFEATVRGGLAKLAQLPRI